jgi:transposase InsO family protein
MKSQPDNGEEGPQHSKCGIRPIIEIYINGTLLSALVDSGADRSTITPELARQLALPLRSSKEKVYVAGHTDPVAVDSETTSVSVTVKGAERQQQLTTTMAFLLLPSTPPHVVLGTDWMLDTGATLDMPRQRVTFSLSATVRTAEPQRPFFTTHLDMTATAHAEQIQTIEDDASLDDAIPDVPSSVIDDAHITSDASEANEPLLKKDNAQDIPEDVLELLREFPSITPTSVAQMHVANLQPFSIATTTEVPLAQPPYRLSPIQRQALHKIVEDLLTAGIIRRSTSPYAAPAFLVPKPGTKDDPQWRMVIDYRRLNSVTIADASPIPTVRDILDEIGNFEYVTELDFTSGFYQMPLADDSVGKTAFVTQDGHFEFLRLPMGPRNGPAAFNRAVKALLENQSSGLPLKCYFDNIYLVTKKGGRQEHLAKLRETMELLRQHQLSINVPKSKFAKQELNILGFHIKAGGYITSDPAKVAPLLNRPAPSNAKELQIFLGLSNYYHRLIEGYAKIAAPLFKLLKRDTRWEWSQDCEAAYRELIRRLCSEPCVRAPILDEPFLLHTDASSVAIGGVLVQRGTDGLEHPVAYTSRILRGAERHYASSELECLAVVHALQKFRDYFFGARITIYSDNRALQWLRSVKNPQGRLARWLFFLQTFDFDIVYKKGRENSDADALSRPPRTLQIMVLTRAQERAQLAASTKQPSAETATATDAAEEHDLRQPKAEGSAENRELDLQRPEVPVQHTIQDGCDDACIEKDPWKHDALMQYLQTGRWLSGLSRKQMHMIEQRSQHLRWNDVTKQLEFITDSRHGTPKIRVIPHPNERATLVDQAHIFGHFGVESTYNRLKDVYYWPNMYRDVDDTVKSCVMCLRAKLQPKVFDPARTVPTSGLMDLVAIDLVFGFPESADGYIGICTIIDCFSQYPMVKPIRTKSADEIASILFQWIALFGPPTTLLSDNGREFINSVIDSMTNLMGVERLVTSPYHPETNGRLEKFNGTFVEALRTIAQNHDPAQWPQFIPFLELAYRTRVHSTTGYTPMFLLLGKQANRFIDYRDSSAVGEIWEQNRSDGNQDAMSTEHLMASATQLVRRAEEIRHLRYVSEELQAALAEKRRLQRERQDGRHVVSGEPLTTGTKVWVVIGQRPGKLTPRYTGPYEVYDQTERGNYRLRTTTGNILIRSVPREKLKVQKADSVIDNQSVFRVENIIDHRPSRNGSMEYRVKWQGYSLDDASWEPESSFIDLDPIDLYWSQREQADAQASAMAEV